MNDQVTKKLPSYTFAKKHGIVVTLTDNDHAKVYFLSTVSVQALSEVKRLLQCHLELEQVDQHAFQQHLAQVYQSKSNVLDAAIGMEEDIDLSLLADQLPTSEDLLDTQDDAPVIRLINALFTQAIKQKASDIHIETYENRVLVRNRIDGVLQEVLEIQRAIAPLVISRVKVMARLDIAEKRIPQDGRIALRIGGHNIDVRVSTLPSNHGERIVLRILDKQAAQLDLTLLGMPDNTLTTMRKMISEPHGIILITGPTGSGKTTSLYAMLTELNQVSRNILTIEDPIEYDLPGVGQTQVNTKVNMTFAKGLRAILRQDPDVVMIGEIRDLETAEIAVQASLTGHLVLSTLHTNTALGALTRLRDMGVESFLLSSSIVGLIAQRLVRKLCSHCKTLHHLRDDEKELLSLPPGKQITVYEPHGCEHCNHSGYRGRTGIYELIIIDEPLRGMIHRNETLQTMENHIRPTCPSIREDGFKKVLNGETSLAEILRVTSQG
ncbi:GspE family T2SS ATPase variant LspE [Legionella israelensis]|uniref:Type II secretion system protein E n=1 Tax=Legionella israelensis TaxID=454 RepID=A0A0W0VLX6_9GAMM|nr:GspE family T2SS ATPase variant LspE [Legionella israelensis]KTD20777.1 type II protein secretion ATPase LspE [Legionella israelensis]QBS10991.1 type II secretion system protein GspE [Legionella israelensis]SCY06347.1 general secretion pathway protein E [Legionella israelensis DSM 19235]STX57985.1 type II protein secretion ATPase LspE [Legionella israelensis]